MEKQTLSPAAKKVLWISCTGFGLVVVFIIVCAIIANMESKKFLKEGIRVQATINDLYESGNRNNRSHTMRISMFTKATEIEKPKTDTTGKTESEKKINKIIDNLTFNSNIGNYMGLTIDCSAYSYNRYKPGDEITVVYLKGDSTHVRILSELE